MTARARDHGSAAVLPTGQGLAAGGFESPIVARAVTPLWPCLCGARNRLRDTACRHCGTHKP